MNKVEFHLNDYVINENNKICRVIGTRLLPCEDFIEEPTQLLTIMWRENKDERSVSHVEEVPAIKVYGWSWTLDVLNRIGFKKGESLNTVVFRDMISRRSIVIDRTDGSLYAFKSSRHIMMDFVYVDYVHDIQHVFETAGIEFPNLSAWLFVENAKRKPPVRLHGA